MHVTQQGPTTEEQKASAYVQGARQASMLATICLFAWLVRGRFLFACEINCLLASACKHYSSIRA
jgi:hypothetical protein